MHHTEITPQFAADFFKFTDKAKRLCITAHISPDEDSMASLLAAYRLLTDRYPEKEVGVIYGTERIPRYETFQNFDRIEFVKDIADHLDDFDLLVCLDGSQYHRFTARPEALKTFQGKKICIDHHSSPVDEFDLSIIAPRASSTAEIIYLTIGNDEDIDKELAEIFLVGILGDTGNFTYLRPDQTGTLMTAKKLIETGQIEIAALQSRYRTIPPRLLILIRKFLENTQFHRVKNGLDKLAVSWPDFQTSFITREFAEKQGFTDKEIAEAGAIYIASYIRAITGYSWGFVVTPRTNGQVSISFRSLPGSVNVREVAERMGIGGGHDLAAGGTFREEGRPLDSEECLEKVLEWLKENKPVIN